MKNGRNPFLRSSIALTTIATIGFGSFSHSADYYWDTITTGSWGDGANWSDNATSGGTTGVVPLSTDSVTFNQSSVNGAEIISLDGARSITGITINNNNFTTTFRATAAAATNQTLTLGTGGITVASTAGNVTFNQTPATFGVLTIDTGSTTQTWTNNATLFSAGPVTGSGQLTLTGANSSLVNNVSQFSLDLSNYTGNLVLNNSRLVNQVATNGFGTAGTITVNNGAQLGINVTGTTISRAVSIAGNGWYDTGAVQRGAIRFLNSGTFSNTVTLAANSRIVAGAAGEFSGRVTGEFNLEIGRAGGEAGTITFSGSTANDYSGLTTVSSGTLALNKTAGTNAIAGNVLVTSGGTLSNTLDNQIANTATVTVDSNAAVWNLNAKAETINILNLSGSYAANKGITLGGAGGNLTVTTLNMSGAGMTLNSGGTTVNATTVNNTGGTWVFGTASGIQSLVIGSGGLTIGGGSTINVASAVTATTFISLGGNVTSQANASSNTISTSGTNAGQLRLNATRTFDVADGGAASDLTVSAVVVNGTGTGGILKTGAGLMTLGGANLFTGSLTIKEGTLLSTNSTAITTASSLILGDSTGVSTTAATFDMTTASVTYNNAINVVGTNQVNTIRDSSFTLALGGLITLTNANLTLNQATTAGMNVSGGVTGTGNLLLSSSGSGGSLNLITAAVNNTGTITNNGSGASATNISADIGSLVTNVTQNSTTSTLTLSGTNAYTGNTAVSAGTLIATKAVALSGYSSSSKITVANAATLRLNYGGASDWVSSELDSLLANNTSGFAVGSTLALNTANGSGSYDTSISATNFGLSKLGNNVLTLSGNNAYAGVTTIGGTAGGIVVGANNALGTTAGNTTVAVGTSLGFSGGITYSTAETIVGSGAGTAAAGVFTNLSRGFVQSVSGNNTFAGAIQINATGQTRIGVQDNAQLNLTGPITMSGVTNVEVLFRAGGNGDFITLSNSGNNWDRDTNIYSSGTTNSGLKLGVDNALPTGVSVYNSASGAGAGNMLDLAGYNQEMNGLVASGNTLKISNSDNTRTSILTLNNTSNRNTSSGTVIQDGAGKIQVVKIGSFDQIIQTASTYTGGTLIKNGSITLQSGNDRLATSGTVTLGDTETTGKLVIGESSTARNQTLAGLTTTGLGGSVVGAAAANSVLTLNIASGTNSFSGTLGGTGNENNLALTKSGAGTLSLSGTTANTYVGVTTVSGGTLALNKTAGINAIGGNLTISGGTAALQAANQLPDAATVLVSGGILDTGTSLTDTVGVFNMSSGSLNGTGTITATTYGLSGGTVTGNLGTGTMNITGSTALNGTAGATAVNISAGTLTLGSSDRLANDAAVAVSGTGILAIGGNSDTVGAVTLSAGSITGAGGTLTGTSYGVSNTSGTVTISANLAGSGVALAKSNAGALTLSGDNSFSGGLTVGSTGGVTLSHDNAAGTGTIALQSTNTGTTSILITSGGRTIANNITMDSATGRNNIGNASGTTALNGNIIINNNGANIQIIQNNASDNQLMTIGKADFTSTITAATFANNLSFRGSSAIGGGAINSVFNAPSMTVDFNGATNWTINSTGNNWGAVTGLLSTGNLVLGTTDALDTSSRLDHSGAGDLDLNGFNQTIAGLNRTPAVAGAQIINNSATTDSQLTLAGLSADYTYANVIADGASKKISLVMNSAGRTQILTGTNTYTGTTTITAGTLQIGNNTSTGTLGAGDVVNDASLVFNRSNDLSVSNDISGAGSLTKQGAGILTLSGSNSYLGLTTVSGGELRVTTTDAIGGTNVTVTSGQLTLDGGITVSGKSLTTTGSGTNFFGGLQSVSGTNEWAGSVLLGANDSRMGARRNATLVVSGAIDDGAEAFTLVIRNENQNNTSGAGNATTVTELSGVSTYGGNTQLIAGVTRLGGGDNRLPAGTTLQFGGSGANAKFDMNGFNQEVAGLAVMNTVTDTQRDWNANELTNSSGTLSTLTVKTATDQSFGVTSTSYGGSENYVGIITGKIELVKSGSAKLTLTGSNTYTDGTRIDSGTLTLGHASNTLADTGVINVNGGTLDLGANSDTVGAVTLASGSITATGSGTLTGSSYDVRSGSISARLAGSGVALTKSTSGTVTLTAANTYTGTTTVTQGSLVLSGAGSVANSGRIHLAASTTLDIRGVTGGFTLGASQSLTGVGTISALGQTVTATGTLSPGNSPGALIQDGGILALGAGGNLNWQVYDATGSAGLGYDTVSLINNASLSLTSLSNANPYLINLWSLSGINSDVNGDAINFDAAQNYTWTLFSTSSEISNFSADLFQINVGANNGTSGFSNSLNGGVFSVALADNNTDLVLQFTAVPETSVTLLGGLSALLLLRRKRRIA